MLTTAFIDPLVEPRKLDDILAYPPKIVYVSEFDKDACKDFAEEMTEAQASGQSIIPVVIDSYGGDAYGLLGMVDCVNSCSVPVITVVTGKAMSSGAALFSCGSERYMGPNATLMIHEVSGLECGKNAELKAGVQEADRLNSIILKLMAKNCGHPADYFIENLHKRKNADWYLSANVAKKHKLATCIGIPRLTTRITVDFEVGL